MGNHDLPQFCGQDAREPPTRRSFPSFLFSSYEFLVKRALFFHEAHPRSTEIIASLSENVL
ncbi:MAG: hypothetical protein AUJ04_04670 [Acidobacteria bacterium 13_1_40CM_3_55_6]|nr:MAG: hypothetical protein AUJ04_04670 [Acidobacteria bacterium 13_1_40CM_3_55_6]